MHSLPFAGLNLRRNPFGEPPAEERPVLFVGNLGDWPGFLNGGSGRVLPFGGYLGAGAGARPFLQLLGPSGCGKSTLLEALREHFPEAPFVAWSAVNGWPILPKATSGPLFVDDAQELTESHLHRVFRFGAVAVATQKDLAVSFSKAGFQVRTERVKDRTDFFGLLQIVERRLEWARRGSGPLPRIEEGALRSLSLLHKHDLRAIQSDLYDLFQKLEACE